jgi:hypothetical protein
MTTVLLIALFACDEEASRADAGAADASRLDSGMDADLDASATDAEPSRETCDEEGELCCSDMRCGGSLSCAGGICGFAACGGLDAPCCDPTGIAFCDAMLVCEEGVCVVPHCGSERSACCATEPRCREDFDCVEGTCVRCGDRAEQCCPGGTCAGDLVCNTERGPPGFCFDELPACGAIGERCCAEGDACEAGLGCMFGPPGSIGGLCERGPECGADRRVCCDGATRCGSALLCVEEPDGVSRCQRCGAHGLPCCDGAVACDPGLACDAGACALPP